MKYLVFTLFLFAMGAEARTCFNKHMARNYHSVMIDSFVVEVGRRSYKVETWPCPELRWADAIGFDSFGSQVCALDTVLVYDRFRRRMPVDRCPIHSIVEVENR
tara:strand:+ start:6788 stop:7099 length:312 start_codon:yes stop_codon:yes gene_type:complete